LRTPEKVEALIKDDAETLALWREAVTNPNGVKHPQAVDNVNSLERSAGNSRSYTLSRLKREAPELFERVVDGGQGSRRRARRGRRNGREPGNK
jgi:hypothetical protein